MQCMHARRSETAVATFCCCWRTGVESVRGKVIDPLDLRSCTSSLVSFCCKKCMLAATMRWPGKLCLDGTVASVRSTRAAAAAAEACMHAYTRWVQKTISSSTHSRVGLATWHVRVWSLHSTSMEHLCEGAHYAVARQQSVRRTYTAGRSHADGAECARCIHHDQPASLLRPDCNALLLQAIVMAPQPSASCRRPQHAGGSQHSERMQHVQCTGALRDYQGV